MAPGPVLLCLCLGLSAVAPSIHNLSCYYNYNSKINCEWLSESSDLCTIEAQKINYYNLKHFHNYSSNCTLGPPDQSGLRRCSLLFKRHMKSYDVLSLNLSCAHLFQSLVLEFKLEDHVKLEAPGIPVVNGSSLSWAPHVVNSCCELLLKYEVQWTSQQHSWAEGWSKSINCKQQRCPVELDTETLVVRGRYRARIRGRLLAKMESEWSDWGPILSWESLVGEEQPGSWVGLSWVFGAVGGVMFLLFLIILRTSRTLWLYVMRLVKGDPLPSPAPSVLKVAGSPFSGDFFLTFFRPVDIASVEVLPAVPGPLQCPLLEDKPPAIPIHLRPSQSNFSNPMYSELCPPTTTMPLLSCSKDSPYDPPRDSDANPDPNPDLQSHMGELPCPELAMLLQLMSQQCQGVPVVCEYERVEAVGTSGDRVRLTSVDSGVSSGEEVSHDSLYPLEDQAGGSSSVLEDQTALHTPRSHPPMLETA
ncbi:interleukin-2 receptor subunit beta-like [Periophthalmus magnuspinnatus]|uniref:interleukin-2 receptor subunit beta-like n=1 Tax=Periophthalmus magnuspinnatus TaxID=409849 RepID=UPI0024365A8F|nr:interleukin-2 receptor subunit beta-like [Periophthalmus magnuspinnatus]